MTEMKIDPACAKCIPEPLELTAAVIFEDIPEFLKRRDAEGNIKPGFTAPVFCCKFS